MILFESKEKCCACGACLNKCPRDAIQMEEDEYGFLYPRINTQKCIECGVCVKVCDLKKKKEKQPQLESGCYFAVCKNSNILMESTSGGLFSIIAQRFIENNGEVYGCSLQKKDDNYFEIKHIKVDKKEELKIILGSKYVQSRADVVFNDIKKSLQKNKKVLFCGTPCQVAGLKNYLGKGYENLYTIDLVCHGTPNVKLFNDFIKSLEKKYKKEIVNVNFRKKLKKISSNVFFYFEMLFSNGKTKRKFCKLLSYYGLFLDGDIYRESCYKCQYANANRQGDITLGDGWGIEKRTPQLLVENGGEIDNFYGSNSVMVNSSKGKALFEMILSDIICDKVDFSDISEYNHQLCYPSVKKEYYEKIMQMYKEEGYEALDRFYFKEIGKKNIIRYGIYYPLSRKIPSSLKKILKK